MEYHDPSLMELESEPEDELEFIRQHHMLIRMHYNILRQEEERLREFNELI